MSHSCTPVDCVGAGKAAACEASGHNMRRTGVQVMASHHSLLDRQALLLRATEPVTEADRALLQVGAG